MFPTRKWRPLPPVRRTAGESLRQARERLEENWLLPLVSAVVLSWGFWFVTQMQVWQHQPPQPGLYLGLAIIVTGVAAIVLGRLFGVFRNLNRGERGELLVAEQLEELRAMGYRPFHDIPGDGFNVDHVVVGPAGVFAIETKFRSGSGRISNGAMARGADYNGQAERLSAESGQRPNPQVDWAAQARGCAAEVHRMIRESCGLYQWVTPLVVVVGDWTLVDQRAQTETRVVPLARLQDYFRWQDQPELTKREIDLIASHLERTGRESKN